MDPSVAAGIIGGGGMLGGIFNYMSGKETNETNERLSNEQMAFQERMSNTAYQRSAHDMTLAGINPIMGYSKGGASTPSGSQPTQVAPTMDVGGALSSALSAARFVTELKATDATVKKTAADTLGSLEEARLKGAAADKAQYEVPGYKGPDGELAVKRGKQVDEAFITAATRKRAENAIVPELDTARAKASSAKSQADADELLRKRAEANFATEKKRTQYQYIMQQTLDSLGVPALPKAISSAAEAAGETAAKGVLKLQNKKVSPSNE